MAFKDDAKQWFETGDYPTQAQFAQVFEWLRWKDEQQAISTITGLQNILNLVGPNVPEAFEKSTGAATAFSYTLGINFLLEKIIIIPTANVQCSLIVDTVTSIENDDVTIAKGTVWTVDLLAITDRAILITGLPLASKIIIFKRKFTT